MVVFGTVVDRWFHVGVVVDRIDTVFGVAVWVGGVVRFSGARLCVCCVSCGSGSSCLGSLYGGVCVCDISCGPGSSCLGSCGCQFGKFCGVDCRVYLLDRNWLFDLTRGWHATSY